MKYNLIAEIVSAAPVSAGSIVGALVQISAWKKKAQYLLVAKQKCPRATVMHLRNAGV